jgi:hypothetical protein
MGQLARLNLRLPYGGICETEGVGEGVWNMHLVAGFGGRD